MNSQSNTDDPQTMMCESRNALVPSGFGLIIQHTMQTSNISLRHLAKERVIPQRWRRNFFQRVDDGNISMINLRRLCDHLNIDMIRATIAVDILHKPMAYFDNACEASANYIKELGRALDEQANALDGDFYPIKRNLCRGHVARITNEIQAHQIRIGELMDEGLNAQL